MRIDDAFYRHLREWFTLFLPRQRGASQNTITACRHTWNMLLDHVSTTRETPLEKITFTTLDRATITEFLEHMATTREWAPSTYNQRLACIRSFFAYAAAAEPVLAVFANDLHAIPLRGTPPATIVKHLTTAAVAALLAAPDTTTLTGLRDQFFMILMYDLAARDAEMLAMTVADLDPKHLSVDLLGKGAKPRRVPVTAQTMEHFRRYTAAFHPAPNPDDALFYTIHRGQRTRMSDDNVARFISQHARIAAATCPDIPARVHPHMLRHSRAMHLYQAGMPLALITEWLGHKSPETTHIYAHADTEMKRRALDRVNANQTATEPACEPVWHGRNDIIIPLTIVQMRRRLVLDFDNGTLVCGGVSYPAAALYALVHTSRHYMGAAQLLTFMYTNGHIKVQVDGFTPSAQTQGRNAALLAFIWQCLPIPAQHAEYIGTELTLVKHLIGKQEATVLLRG